MSLRWNKITDCIYSNTIPSYMTLSDITQVPNGYQTGTTQVLHRYHYTGTTTRVPPHGYHHTGTTTRVPLHRSYTGNTQVLHRYLTLLGLISSGRFSLELVGNSGSTVPALEEREYFFVKPPCEVRNDSRIHNRLQSNAT